MRGSWSFTASYKTPFFMLCNCLCWYICLVPAGRGVLGFRAVNAMIFCVFAFRFVIAKRLTKRFFVAFDKRNAKRNTLLFHSSNATQDIEGYFVSFITFFAYYNSIDVKLIDSRVMCGGKERKTTLTRILSPSRRSQYISHVSQISLIFPFFLFLNKKWEETN